VDALIALDRLRIGGAPEHAARALLDILAPQDPDEAWRLAEQLLDAQLLHIDDVIEALLNACADRPTEAWWLMTGELLVALGVGPLRTLAIGCEAAPELARVWLPYLAERVAVEGRPTERRAWRTSILEAARAVGLSAAEVGIDPPDLEVGDEAPHHYGDAKESEPSEPDSISALLSTAEQEGTPSYERAGAVRKLSKRFDELDQGQVARLRAVAAGSDEDATLQARLAQAAVSAGDLDAALTCGLKALQCSSIGDWSRSWADGLMLEVIPMLLGLDRARVRRAMFQRFADLAGEADYFLGYVAESLGDYVSAFELSERELAHDALEITQALLRDIAPLPSAATLRSCIDENPAAPGDPQAANEALVLWVLGREQTLGWEAAQRTMYEFARCGDAIRALLSGLKGASEVALRTCGVIQAAARSIAADGALTERLETLTRAPRLDLRVAAATSLAAIGRPVPPLGPQGDLPAALRLELPPRDTEHRVLSGLEEALTLWRQQIEELAGLARIDQDTLHDYVLMRAREGLRGERNIEQLPDADSMLGWGYVKPVHRAIRAALTRAAAELLDARRVHARDALRAIELHPATDPGLLQRRPGRRPPAVATFVAHVERTQLYSRQLSDLASGAAERVARRHDEWLVLGEDSEIALLDRPGHQEWRRSGLVRREAADTAPPHIVPGPLGVYEYEHLPRNGQVDRGILRPFSPPAATPVGWLALHPGIADALGLRLAEPGWLDWTLNSRPAVCSMWWRSGYLYWNPYSDRDEVGEGWLVLGSPELVDHLRAEGWELAYDVSTRRRGDGDVSEDKVNTQGRLALAFE